ncbi:EpsG family protein [compost metagenome]
MAAMISQVQAKFLITAVFLILVLFAGLRGLVGADTLSYLTFYDQFKDPDVAASYLTKMEPIFVLLITAHSHLIDSKFLYILMISVLQTWILYLVFKQSSKKYYFLLFYILLFYLNFHFNVTRAAIAAMLFLLALTSSSTKVKLLSAILAPGFHVSVLFFYPLLFAHLNLKRFLLLVFLSIAGLILALQNFSYFVMKYNAYQDYLTGYPPGLSIYNIIIFASVILSIVFLRKFSFLYLAASLFLLISLCIAEVFPIGYRLLSIGLLIYLFFLLEELSRENYKLYYAFFWIPVALTFGSSFYGVLQETTRLEERIEMGIGDGLDASLKSTYIPYQFYWADDDI